MIQNGKSIKSADVKNRNNTYLVAVVPNHSFLLNPAFLNNCLKIALLFIFLFITVSLFSQSNLSLKDTAAIDAVKSNTAVSDTFHVPVSELIEKMASSELKTSEAIYLKNQLVQKQSKNFNRIGLEIQNAKTILKQGIDYAEFTEELNGVMNFKQVAIKGILDNESKFLTFRNLTTTTILLNEILNRTDNQLKKIRQNSLLITDVQHKIDSLVAEKSLYVVPEDSVAKMIYYQRLLAMKSDIDLLNVKLKNAIDSIQNLEVLSNSFKFKLQSDIAETKLIQKEKYGKMLSAKEDIFTDNNPQKTTFGSSIIYSQVKGYLLLVFYLYNHWANLLILIVFILAISIYLKVLKTKYVSAGLYTEFKFPVQIFRHPFATATLISITVYQFFLPLPPFILTGLLWIISGIALTTIFHKTENKFVFWTWVVFFGLNMVALFDHNILIHSVAESWLILFLAVSVLGFGIYTLYNNKKLQNKPKIWIISGMIILEFLALIFIILGNYNTSKIFMSEGIYTILVGYLLINTFRLSRNIYNFSEYLKESDEEKKIENLKNRPDKISFAGFAFFLIGWLILLTRNSYVYQNFTEPFKEAFSKTREIGEFTFTYQGISTFFLVLFLSGFISKIVSFLADDKRTKAAGAKSSGLGSWLLLVRIGIITTGIIIAFRSAGLPMDRLTIIISALGVGIGFGMQTLVNNLVSGLIIAFEKPINLEDIVEIGGQTGKMKSIGIRSSVLSTWDGADVIIPNGDLLNHHLVNWTLGSNKRRTEIQVGVAYDTDLDKAKSILIELLAKNKRVLKNPPPSILFTNFNDSSIDISIKYWINHFIYGVEIKSELIVEINKAFKQNGITIPFPQRDIHIQNDTIQNEDQDKI